MTSRRHCKHVQGGFWEGGFWYCDECRVGFKQPPHETAQQAAVAPTPADPATPARHPGWTPYDEHYIPPCVSDTVMCGANYPTADLESPEVVASFYRGTGKQATQNPYFYAEQLNRVFIERKEAIAKWQEEDSNE